MAATGPLSLKKLTEVVVGSGATTTTVNTIGTCINTIKAKIIDNSWFDILVDSGSCVSVLPPSVATNFTQTDFNIPLRAANGTELKILGEFTENIGLKTLRRRYLWKLLVADIHTPILGADFLNSSGLLVDCTNRILIDPTTNIAAQLEQSKSNVNSIKIGNVVWSHLC